MIQTGVEIVSSWTRRVLSLAYLSNTARRITIAYVTITRCLHMVQRTKVTVFSADLGRCYYSDINMRQNRFTQFINVLYFRDNLMAY
jgi:hypothetical protein